jgi:hypothetical protein
MAAFLPLRILAELVKIGTLLAFLIWLAIDFGYSQRHSTIAAHLEQELNLGGASPAGRARAK